MPSRIRADGVHVFCHQSTAKRLLTCGDRLTRRCLSSPERAHGSFLPRYDRQSTHRFTDDHPPLGAGARISTKHQLLPNKLQTWPT
ncbi:hypothetical protein BST61_g3360 [Cercospora zeina]